MTNVLIPTDFTVQSLDLILAASLQVPGKINACLFHAFSMPDSLTDAIYRMGSNSPEKLVTEELLTGIARIKELNPMVADISFTPMYGTTVAAFQNFAEANEIELIALPARYSFTPVTGDSIDPVRMFARSGIKLLKDLYVRPSDIENTVTRIQPGVPGIKRFALR